MESVHGWSPRSVVVYAANMGMAEGNVEHDVQSCCGVPHSSSPLSSSLPFLPFDRESPDSAGRIGLQFLHVSVKGFPLERLRSEICHVVFRPRTLEGDLLSSHSCSPCLPMIPKAASACTCNSMELRRTPISSHAFCPHRLLRRHARSVQLCFSRAHQFDSLVFAPTSR